MKKYYVTTPIYYVNAKPHIGHIYTTIAADVLARWQRKKIGDDNVLFSTGTDENSQKNVEAAQAVEKSTDSYVDEMATTWKNTFEKLGFTYNEFIRTTTKEHSSAVTRLLTKINDAGMIYEGDYEGYYCVGCEAFVAEKDLVDGKCPDHDKEPKKITEKNYFFKLSSYKKQLLKLYKNKDFVQPESARNKMLSYIKNDLQDISISRQAQEWGIRLPQDKEHAVYVWFDALINYLTAAGYPDNMDKFNKYWPADVHIIGKDIIKFHCAIWPAMLLAADLKPPHKIFAHGFFTVDGKKISKSLNNAIDPLELIKEYPFDAIRYYLLREIPFGGDGDFSHDKLRERYNSDLANGLGNLVSRSLNMIEKFWPEYDGSGEISDSKRIDEESAKVETATEKLEFNRALFAIQRLVEWGDERIEKSKPWDLAKEDKKEELQKVLIDIFKVLEVINNSIAPYLPETHQALTKLLTDRPIKKPTEPLFARK